MQSHGNDACVLRAYHPKRVRAKQTTEEKKKRERNKSVSTRRRGGYKKATPDKSVVKLMKTTSQVITANMALEGAMSEEEKLTSRTI